MGCHINYISMMKEELVLKNNVKNIRKKLKMTQKELGDVIGVSRQTINSIENNVYVPSVKLALLISIALEEKFEKIFYFE